MSKRLKRKYLFYAVLPPPYTGMTIVTQKVYEYMGLWGCDVRKMVYSKPAWCKSGFVWRCIRFLRWFWTVVMMLPHRLRGYTNIYLIPESGFGVIFTLLMIMYAKALGMRCVLHNHVYSYVNARNVFYALICVLLGREDVSICLGPRMISDLRRMYNCRCRVECVENYLILDPNCMKLVTDREREGPLVVGYLCNICEEKGIDDVLSLVERFKEEDVLFKVAGPVSDELIRKRIMGVVGRFDNIDYIGPVYGDRKELFYKSLDLFVFPTKYANEASPLVLIEAVSKGVPFIAYNRGGIVDLACYEGCIVVNYYKEMEDVMSTIIQGGRLKKVGCVDIVQGIERSKKQLMDVLG